VNILDFVPEQIAAEYELASNPIVIWTVILLVYCFFASVLPVWTLLQPRDYINSHQLLLALGLLVVGLMVASATGQADINSAKHYVETEKIANAPPILPFLFITIACGAVSGFHCLVSSGTSSKQLSCEPDAQYVGYGAMLLEGALAVIVILACCAGVGMGKFDRTADKAIASGYRYQPHMTESGEQLVGNAAWKARYDAAKGWGAFGLGAKVGAFIEGGANFMTTIGVPLKLAIGIVAVLVASFAATTLDTATRLQRYVVQELAASARIKPLTNKYAATALALLFGGAMAMLPGPKGVPGTGGLILWPLFGAVNQLLAGMAFLVTMFYLWRRNKPIWFAVVPTLMMIGLPAWALLWQMFNATTGWYHTENHLLMGIAAAVMALQIWMVVEALLMWPRAKGVLEEALPPLEPRPDLAGGRSC
jgi:carbon starvation protein